MLFLYHCPALPIHHCDTQQSLLSSAFHSTAAQFKRAVKIATGQELSENVLDTVFQIFDLDGDNCLSHKEFIAVMKDRMLRGLRVSICSRSFVLLFFCHLH